VYVRIIDNRDDTIVEEITVAVQNVYEALAEAINERILANTGTAGTYSDEDSASTLRSAAISAINGYAKSAIAADGTFTAFNSSNHGIATAEETTQWYAETYDIVKTAVSKIISLTVNDNAKGYKTSGRIYGTYSGSGTSADPYVVESPESIKQRAVTACNAAQWDTSESGELDGFGGAIKSYTHYDGWTDGSEVLTGNATISISFWVRRYSVMPYVNGNVDLYLTSGSTHISQYDTFGHNVPSAANTTAKCGSFAVVANTQNVSPWFGTSNGQQLEGSTGQPDGQSGYKIYLNKAIIHYNFKHK
jgi:hypothetical protein